MPGPELTLVVSPSAAERVSRAHTHVAEHAASEDVLIVGATRSAADELAAAVAMARGGLFGVSRASFHELVLRLALPGLARQGVSPTGGLGAEAVVTRATFEAATEGTLQYFGPVAGLPGFPRAAARTLGELQLAGIDGAALSALDQAGRDLSDLLARVTRETARAGTVTRADVLAAAADAVSRVPNLMAGVNLVLLDVAVTSAAEERVLHTLLAAVDSAFSTVPTGDARTVAAYTDAGGIVTVADDPRRGSVPALRRLQRHLFAESAPPSAPHDDSVVLFSAPGEGREAVEIARRLMQEADHGVRFDQMAVLLRAPNTYFGLLEHALSRAGVPAWFERGTRRPDPAGRAFLALLACADENLSARRFAEYLSLGQVPVGPRPAPDGWVAPADEAASAMLPVDDRAEDAAPEDEAPAPTERDADRIVAGTLRAPWRWEELLVESYVIQGLDRWKRRLPGLRHEYERRLRELRGDDTDSPRIAALERDREQLRQLEDFAVPIVEALDTWRAPRLWGEWLEAFAEWAPRVIRQPVRVLRVLGELTPLGSVGPVGLREVRDVLAPRLRTLTHEPPRRRHGCVFVGTPAAARGRTFRVVCVPGLAERIFPQRIREDALLLDARRRQLPHGLPLADQRTDEERLHLRLAVGAASERVYLSYPRLELQNSRPRVPSFYALDVERAVSGTIPRYTDLSDRAARAGAASLSWPAPQEPACAIDEFEHDLAVILPLLRERNRKKVEGRARYLIEVNAALKRSITERWARWEPRWHQSDGLIRVTPDTAPALARQRLTARPFSLTALQRFASCPYQFQLAALYQLSPLEEPAPLQRLDPLTRGSLFHDIQAACLRRLQANGHLPVTAARLPAARGILTWAIQEVAEQAKDDLAPAIERVWNDEVATLTRDLQRWLEQLADAGREWTPERFELAFGLPEGSGRDPASYKDPALVAGRFLLRGSIDLVERRPGTTTVRVTDHKTGKNRTTRATIVDGGRVLQPVLYGLALEQLSGDTVESGRLSYCTSVGGFSDHEIPLDELTRRRGVEVLEIVDRAIEHGTLAAYPAHEACAFCDFQPVCGHSEERRTLRKPEALFADLLELRRRP